MLERFERPCLTQGCDHGLRHGNICKGYFTHGTLLTLEGFSLKSSEAVFNPLLQSFFCEVFSRLEDPAKSPCKGCSASGFSLREDFDGLYCHGCGLFIDFTNRRLGFSEEWTTRTLVERESPSESLNCKNCACKGIRAKFGDYAFCSKQCLHEWYSELAGPDPLAHPSHYNWSP